MEIQDIVQNLLELSKMNQQITQYTENIESFFGQKLASNDAIDAAKATYDEAVRTKNLATRIVSQIEAVLSLSKMRDSKTTKQLEKALTVANKELETATKNVIKLKKAYILIAKKTIPKDMVDTLKDILKKIKKSLVSLPAKKDFAYDYDGEFYYVAATFSDDSQIQVTKQWSWKLNNKKAVPSINLFFNYDKNTGFRTVEEAASAYLKGLENRGSENLQGNSGLGALVKSKIPEIIRNAQRFLEQKGDTYNRFAEYKQQKHMIEGSTRTNIDQADYGQYDDDWRYEAEQRLDKPFKELMGRYSDVIAKVDSDLGEKGWWYFTIVLKGKPQ